MSPQLSRCFKLSVLLDPALDSEFARLPQAKVRERFTSCVKLRGAEPSEDIEPSLSSSSDYKKAQQPETQFLAFAVITRWGQIIEDLPPEKNQEGWPCHAALRWISCAIQVFSRSPRFSRPPVVSWSSATARLPGWCPFRDLSLFGSHGKRLLRKLTSLS